MKVSSVLHAPSAAAPALAPSKNTGGLQDPNLRDFEAMFMTTVVDEMLKTVDLGTSMGGHAAEMWRSVLSEALAESLVLNSDLGIAGNISREAGAYAVQIGAPDE